MSYIKQKDENSGGTIGGTIANEQIAYGSATDTIAGSNNLTWDGEKVTIKNSNGQDALRLESTSAGTNPCPDLRFFTNRAGVANADLGHIFFSGQDSGGATQDYVDIYTEIDTPTAGDEAGRFYLRVSDKGTLKEIVRVRGEDSAGQARVDFNRNTDDIDFIVNGQSAYLIWADANKNQVGIGTNSPNQKLTVQGSISLDEQSSAGTSTAGYGQIWVKDTAPNTLYFTDDSGTDHQLGAGGGGGGMLPRGQFYKGANAWEEILGCTGGINIEQASVFSTANWNNTTARWRPHCFHADGALGVVNIGLQTNSITSGTRTMNVGIWNMDADGRIGTKKATTSITMTSATSTGNVTSAAWSAEAGQDTNVEAGKWYWIAFDASGGGGSVTITFWQSVRLPSAGISVVAAAYTAYQTLYNLGDDVVGTGDSPSILAGDASGITWPVMGMMLT